jgi:glycosyltransferase involved in cell wall biosynthesis
MFVSGFTIVRNAEKYDYPVVESIQSILPICDEIIVLVGQSEDNTLGLIQSIGSNKIKIYHSIWDDTLREGGTVLAVETDKAKNLISPEADWCFYIQADEVVNEVFYPNILEAMQTFKNNQKVEGLLFSYQHFFGNFNYVAKSRGFYRHEIRIVRNLPAIHSYRDAQGFRIAGKKLNVKKIKAEIFHYGWVRTPEIMKKKIKDFHQLWHSDQWIAAQEEAINDFDYSEISSLEVFKEKHPTCMEQRILNKNWDYQPRFKQKKVNLKHKCLFWIEQKTGYRIGEYKNYKLI